MQVLTKDAIEKAAFSEALGILERGYYTDEELSCWLQLPQPLIDNKTPIELLASGRKDELLRVIRCMDDGAYL